jgi:hypothetical protein
MRRIPLTCSLAILGLPLFAGCADSHTTYYTEPQALEAMRRNAAENADHAEALPSEPTPSDTSGAAPASDRSGGGRF